jgi:predicted small secreted protein
MENQMKKTFLLVIVLILVGLATSGCEIDMVSGSGHVITQTRSVSGFNAVSFAGMGDMTIVQGSSEGLTIEAEDNVLDRIKTEVKNGTLYIGFERDNWQDVIRPTRAIRFNLNLRNLNGLDISGLGNINLAKLKGEEVTLKMSGAGSVKIEQLEASSITCNMSGAGNVELTGKVTSQSITMSGLGNYSGGDLQSQQAKIVLSGAGGANVWATETLDVRISGAGSVSYYGTPKVTKNISGVGVLNSQGKK